MLVAGLRCEEGRQVLWQWWEERGSELRCEHRLPPVSPDDAEVLAGQKQQLQAGESRHWDWYMETPPAR